MEFVNGRSKSKAKATETAVETVDFVGVKTTTTNVGSTQKPTTCHLPPFTCPNCGARLVYEEDDTTLIAKCPQDNCGFEHTVFEHRPGSTTELEDAMNALGSRIRRDLASNRAVGRIPSTLYHVEFTMEGGVTTRLLICGPADNIHRTLMAGQTPMMPGFVAGRVFTNPHSPITLSEYNALPRATVNVDRILSTKDDRVVDVTVGTTYGRVTYGSDGGMNVEELTD